MPALPPVPKVVRLDHHFTISEDTAAKCRLYLAYTGAAPSNTDLGTLAAALTPAWNANMKPMFGNTRELTTVDLTDLSSPTAAHITSSVLLIGTRAGTNVPADIATLASQHIARRFRGGHSRVYWPAGVVSDTADGQTWQGAFLSAFAGALNAYIAALEAGVWGGGGTLSPVNVSQYQGFSVHTGTTGRARNVSTPRVNPLIDAILSYTIQAGIATIRKRLLGLA